MFMCDDRLRLKRVLRNRSTGHKALKKKGRHIRQCMADQAFIGVGMGIARDFCNAKVEYMWKNTLWKKKFTATQKQG